MKNDEFYRDPLPHEQGNSAAQAAEVREILNLCRGLPYWKLCQLGSELVAMGVQRLKERNRRKGIHLIQ